MDSQTHKPVLLQEVLEALDPQPGKVYVDATANGGGHLSAILEKIGQEGRILGIDWDDELIAELKTKYKTEKRVMLACGNFANIKAIMNANGLRQADGILADVGFSSYHIEKSGRGFSFLKDEPLDMRYHPEAARLSAQELVNTWGEGEIERILREYGEERFAKKIAVAIVNARHQKKIVTSGELARIISMAVPSWYRRGRIHPATRTFQALRIAVNGELDNIKIFLEDAMGRLKNKGVLAVITFHSLEDRIVKHFFKTKEKEGLLVSLAKKPMKASVEETRTNPRARSAKLRAAKIISVSV